MAQRKNAAVLRTHPHRYGAGRREILMMLGGAAAWPLAAQGQDAGPRKRIAVLLSARQGDHEYQGYIAGFREALEMHGWSERRNIQIDYRWGALDAQSQERFAKELVALRPHVIVTQNTPTTAAVLQQTRSIPIVFAAVSDPVGSGFVVGLPRPGANVTGFIDLEGSLAGKWLELLKEIVPTMARTAFLFNPATAPFAEYYLKPFRAAALSLAVEAISAPVKDESELEARIATQAREPNSGLIVMPEAFLNAHAAQVTTLAARYRLPAVYPHRFFTQEGGLMSYGNDLRDSFRRAASYADRILRGEKPDELPVQLPINFQLAINNNAAKGLGITIPELFLLRADEVIE